MLCPVFGTDVTNGVDQGGHRGWTALNALSAEKVALLYDSAFVITGPAPRFVRELGCAIAFGANAEPNTERALSAIRVGAWRECVSRSEAASA
eukprot:3936267-Rhodomonas_salina.1